MTLSIKTSQAFLRENLLKILLFAILSFFFLYLLSKDLRDCLEKLNIDPNFVVGFITATTLIVSLLQRKSDRKYAYNLKLIDSIEEKGLLIIGKVFGLYSHSQTLLSTAKECVEAINAGEGFRDLNNSLSKERIQNEIEVVLAYQSTYFPEIVTDWNELQKKLTEIANPLAQIIVTYERHQTANSTSQNFVISRQGMKETIEKADANMVQLEKLCADISSTITLKINSSKKKLKDQM